MVLPQRNALAESRNMGLCVCRGVKQYHHTLLAATLLSKSKQIQKSTKFQSEELFCKYKRNFIFNSIPNNLFKQFILNAFCNFCYLSSPVDYISITRTHCYGNLHIPLFLTEVNIPRRRFTSRSQFLYQHSS